MRLLEKARARLRSGESIHEIRLSDLAKDCGVTRAAAVFHFAEGMRGIVAGLAMESFKVLLGRLERLPRTQTAAGAAMTAAALCVLDALLENRHTALAVQSVRWTWHAEARDAVKKASNRVVNELEKRLLPGVDPRLVVGLAEFFLGEVVRGDMSRKVAERSLVDTLERIASP